MGRALAHKDHSTFRDLLEAKTSDQIEIEAAERGRAQQRGQIHEYR